MSFKTVSCKPKLKVPLGKIQSANILCQYDVSRPWKPALQKTEKSILNLISLQVLKSVYQKQRSTRCDATQFTNTSVSAEIYIRL